MLINRLISGMLAAGLVVGIPATVNAAAIHPSMVNKVFAKTEQHSTVGNGPFHVVNLPNQAQLPANFGDPVTPPSDLTRSQLATINQQNKALQSFAVQQAIQQAIRRLPSLHVNPNGSAYETTTVDGFTIAEGVTNQTSGDPVSTFTTHLNLYDVYGLHLATIYYHDAYHWTGSSVNAASPYWTHWEAWWAFLDSFSPGTSSVTNWGSESVSHGYCNFVLSISLGTVHWNFTGYATMYANGNASGGID